MNHERDDPKNGFMYGRKRGSGVTDLRFAEPAVKKIKDENDGMAEAGSVKPVLQHFSGKTHASAVASRPAASRSSSKLGTVAMPFMVDDSSGDEVEEVKPASTRRDVRVTVAARASPGQVKLNAQSVDKAAQKAASERLRLEAQGRKQERSSPGMDDTLRSNMTRDTGEVTRDNRKTDNVGTITIQTPRDDSLARTISVEAEAERLRRQRAETAPSRLANLQAKLRADGTDYLAKEKAQQDADAAERRREAEAKEEHERREVERLKIEEDKKDATHQMLADTKRKRAKLEETLAKQRAQATEAEEEKKQSIANEKCQVQRQHTQPKDAEPRTKTYNEQPALQQTIQTKEVAVASPRAISAGGQARQQRIDAMKARNAANRASVRQEPLPPFEEGAKKMQDAEGQRIQAMRDGNKRDWHRTQRYADNSMLAQLTDEKPSTLAEAGQPPLSSLIDAKPTALAGACHPPPLSHEDIKLSAPVSLNSPAEQNALARLNAEPRQSSVPVPSNAQSTKDVPQPKQRRRLGEIKAEDAKLVLWKGSNMSWTAIQAEYERSTGRPRSIDVLSRRCRQVQFALDNAGCEGLLHELASGDLQVKEQVNQMVHGRGPVANPIRNDRLRSDTGHFISTTESTCPPTPSPPTRPRGSSRSAAPSDYEETSLDLPSSQAEDSGMRGSHPVPNHEVMHSRPTTGGKTISINKAEWGYYLQCLAEVAAEDIESESDIEREQSPFMQEDYCHFAYQVQRREVTKDEMDAEGLGLDDMPWVDWESAHDNLARAHKEAAEISLRAQCQVTADAMSEQGFTIQYTKDEDGLKLWTLTTKEAGAMQVRVERRMRTYQQGILPQSKDHWAPKTVYFVKQRVTSKVTGDELFEAGSETVLESNVEDTAYTTLDLANTKAIEFFVKESYRPKSASLTLRDLALKAERQRLVAELDAEGEGARFKSSVDSGQKSVEVWVEVGRLAGPRNL